MRSRALKCYKKALLLDPYLNDAGQSMVSILTPDLIEDHLSLLNLLPLRIPQLTGPLQFLVLMVFQRESTMMRSKKSLEVMCLLGEACCSLLEYSESLDWYGKCLDQQSTCDHLLYKTLCGYCTSILELITLSQSEGLIGSVTSWISDGLKRSHQLLLSFPSSMVGISVYCKIQLVVVSLELDPRKKIEILEGIIQNLEEKAKVPETSVVIHSFIAYVARIAAQWERVASSGNDINQFDSSILPLDQMTFSFEFVPNRFDDVAVKHACISISENSPSSFVDWLVIGQSISDPCKRQHCFLKSYSIAKSPHALLALISLRLSTGVFANLGQLLSLIISVSPESNSASLAWMLDYLGKSQSINFDELKHASNFSKHVPLLIRTATISNPVESLALLGRSKTMIGVDLSVFDPRMLLVAISAAQSVVLEKCQNLLQSISGDVTNSKLNELIGLGLARCYAIQNDHQSALNILNNLKPSFSVDLSRAFCLFTSSETKQDAIDLYAKLASRSISASLAVACIASELNNDKVVEQYLENSLKLSRKENLLSKHFVDIVGIAYSAGLYHRCSKLLALIDRDVYISNHSDCVKLHLIRIGLAHNLNNKIKIKRQILKLFHEFCFCSDVLLFCCSQLYHIGFDSHARSILANLKPTAFPNSFQTAHYYYLKSVLNQSNLIDGLKALHVAPWNLSMSLNVYKGVTSCKKLGHQGKFSWDYVAKSLTKLENHVSKHQVANHHSDLLSFIMDSPFSFESNHHNKLLCALRLMVAEALYYSGNQSQSLLTVRKSIGLAKDSKFLKSVVDVFRLILGSKDGNLSTISESLKPVVAKSPNLFTFSSQLFYQFLNFDESLCTSSFEAAVLNFPLLSDFSSILNFLILLKNENYSGGLEMAISTKAKFPCNTQIFNFFHSLFETLHSNQSMEKLINSQYFKNISEFLPTD
ncbi:hypothetical protein GEMRC1_001440 [Eukaryota sp. GEM-RC1]